MGKKILKLAIAAAIIGIAFLLWANHVYTSPANYTETKHVIIEKGAGTASILYDLNEAGVISNPLIVRLMAKLKGDGNLRYGEYIFEPGMSPQQALQKLQKGEVVIRKVTIAEGRTVYEALEILGKAEGLKGEIPDNIEEGSLLPQTYYYQWGQTYESVISQMRKGMADNLDRMWEFRRMDIPIKTKQEALILASIVEKETGVADERGMVASVFINRLRIGMPLQSDPTAVYGITAGAPLGRLPSGADMKSENPYNTYKIKGLPPGPICNPGADSIEAVLNPADTNYLYFVADGLGGHNFSTVLAEHNENVNVYRKARSVSNRQKSNMIIKP